MKQVSFLLLILVSVSLNSIAQEKISLSNKYGYYLEGTKKGRTLIDGTDLIVKHTGRGYDHSRLDYGRYEYYVYNYFEQTTGTISTKGRKTYLTGEYSKTSKSRRLDQKTWRFLARDYCYYYEEYYKVLGDFTVSNSDAVINNKIFTTFFIERP